MTSSVKLVILLGVIVTMLALVAEKEVYASPVPEPCGDEGKPKEKEDKKDAIQKKEDKLDKFKKLFGF